MTDYTVESTIADDDSVGDAFIASLKLYEVFDDDIKYCFHEPKIMPWNEQSVQYAACDCSAFFSTQEHPVV